MIRVLSGEPRELPQGEVRAELREAAFRGADRRRALCTASRGPGGAQGASESPTHRTERLALEHGAGALLRPTGQRARTISAPGSTLGPDAIYNRVSRAYLHACK